MRALAALALVALTGCTYVHDYEVRAHNESDTTIAMRLVNLRPGGGRTTKMFAGIAPGTEALYLYRVRSTEPTAAMEAMFRAEGVGAQWSRHRIVNGQPSIVELRIEGDEVVVERRRGG